MHDKLVAVTIGAVEDEFGTQMDINSASILYGDEVFHFKAGAAVKGYTVCLTQGTLVSNIWDVLLSRDDPARYVGWKMSSRIWPTLVINALRFDIPIPNSFKAPLDRYYPTTMPIIDVFNIYRQGRAIPPLHDNDITFKSFLALLNIPALHGAPGEAQYEEAKLKAMLDLVNKYHTPYIPEQLGDPVPVATGWEPLDA